MLASVHAGDAGSNPFNPLQVFSTKAVVYFLPRNWSDKPGRILKKISVSKFHARLLFSSHGMSREKAHASVLAKHGFGTLQHFRLRASDISEQGLRRQRGPEPVNRVDDPAYWRRKNDDLAATNCVRGICVAGINRT